jgi:hypothetical protein
VIYTPLPKESYYDVVPAPKRPENKSGIICPENAVSFLITLLSSRYPFFIYTAVVHSAHTAVAGGVVLVLGSNLEALLASESAGLRLPLPSYSARLACDAGPGRIYRCGSRRPCRA